MDVIVAAFPDSHSIKYCEFESGNGDNEAFRLSISQQKLSYREEKLVKG